MLHLFKSVVLRQYVAVVIANLTIISLGLHVVWSSPMLVKLRDEDETVLATPPTQNEEAWIVAIANISASPMLLLTGPLINYFGKKYMILFLLIPRLATCFLLTFATEVWIILLGRSMGGLTDFTTLITVSTYASEVAGKQIRGASGTLTQIMSAIGMMIMFAVGPFVSYLAVNIVMICMAFATYLPMFFVPESPYFLYSKGRTQDALEVLMVLRGSEELAHEEIREYAASNTDRKLDLRSLLKDRTVVQTFTLVIFLSIGLQFVGYNAVNLYLQTIFESTQTTISSEISSLIIGLIQLLACCCTFLLTDKFGRKPILCISIFGMFVGMIGLGTFFILFDNGHEITGFLNFLPLLSIIIIIYGFNAGLGSLFWIVVAELFEGPLRSHGVSCGCLITTISAFLLTLFFPSMVNSIGAGTTYYIFSGVCLIVCLTIFVFLPETKGKTFAEIQIALGRKQLRKDQMEKI